MKILYSQNNVQPFENGFDNYPDSCLLRNNESFYFPNFTSNISAEACLVVKIDKLGKCFAERFSNRYYHQYTLGINFKASDHAKVLSPSICNGFDKSLAIGSFIDFQLNFPEVFRFQYNETSLAFQLKDGFGAIDKICAQLSQYFTFKIGDLLVISLGYLIDTVSIGDNFITESELPLELITAIK